MLKIQTEIIFQNLHMKKEKVILINQNKEFH